MCTYRTDCRCLAHRQFLQDSVRSCGRENHSMAQQQLTIKHCSPTQTICKENGYFNCKLYCIVFGRSLTVNVLFGRESRSFFGADGRANCCSQSVYLSKIIHTTSIDTALRTFSHLTNVGKIITIYYANRIRKDIDSMQSSKHFILLQDQKLFDHCI